FRSRIATWGRQARACLTASCPLAASARISKPSFSSSTRRLWRTISWSSARSNRTGIAAPLEDVGNQQSHLGARPGAAAEVQLAPDAAQPFAHPGQAHAVGVGVHRLGLETTAVVAHAYFERVAPAAQLHPHMAGRGMADHVVEALLNAAIQAQLDRARGAPRQRAFDAH